MSSNKAFAAVVAVLSGTDIARKKLEYGHTAVKKIIYFHVVTEATLLHNLLLVYEMGAKILAHA